MIAHIINIIGFILAILFTRKDTANIGFIAQDVVGTNVGSRIVSVSEDGKHSYNLGTYVSTLAGALQVAINKIDELEKMIKTGF